MGSVLTFDTKRCLIGAEDLEQISNPKKLLYPVARFSNSESKVIPGPMTLRYASSLAKAGRFRAAFPRRVFGKQDRRVKGPTADRA
jgi:hypothetical protein